MVTAQRPNSTVYLYNTLNFLLKNADRKELDEIYIIILLADLDEKWRENVTTTIRHKYTSAVRSGTIQLLQTFEWLYPKLENLTHYHIWYSPLAAKWKAKQNIDFAILWLYVAKSNLSEYYLHIEDDVITVPDYIKAIKDYINGQKHQSTCLEFSVLGMIAKLYHTHDLEILAKMVTLFYQEQPADVTYLNFNPQMFQDTRLIRKPTLFQHMGIKSSLYGIFQRLKDTDFIGDLSKSRGDNPSAILQTSLKVNPIFPPERVYNSHFGQFWSAGPPQTNDYFRIIFEKPQLVKRIVVSSGVKIYPKDKFFHAVLETSSTHNTTDCTDFKAVGIFTNGNIDIEIPKNTSIHCVQIRVTKAQINWVFIRDLDIFVWK